MRDTLRSYEQINAQREAWVKTNKLSLDKSEEPTALEVEGFINSLTDEQRATFIGMNPEQMNYARGRARNADTMGLWNQFPDTMSHQSRICLVYGATGSMVRCVQIYRNVTGLGLKAAKEFVDEAIGHTDPRIPF